MRIGLLVALLVMTLPAMGASSFVGGMSGNILTPDGVVVPTGTWELSYHQFSDFLVDNDLNTFGITYGLTDNLEVGATFVNNGESETALNAKLSLLPETPERPAIIVGAFDIGGTADELNDDPGLYLVISKNVTPQASEIAGEPSKPLRLSVGFGSGVFDGFFAGLDWTLEPRLSLMAEFFGGELGDNDSFFNAGIRYAAAENVRLDLGTIDFEDFAFGANLRFGF